MSRFAFRKTVGSRSAALWVCGVALPVSAYADAPLPHYQVWVDVAVVKCSNAESLLMRGVRWLLSDENDGVGLISGKVVGAGYVAPAPNDEAEAERASQGALPTVGSRISLVLPSWTQASCKGLLAGDAPQNFRRFRFDYRCDVPSMGGVCSFRDLGRLATPL
jgi:hypothetical protein